MRNASSVGVLYAFKGEHTLFTSHRERERMREREYLFLKGMTGALAPGSAKVRSC